MLARKRKYLLFLSSGNSPKRLMISRRLFIAMMITSCSRETARQAPAQSGVRKMLTGRLRHFDQPPDFFNHSQRMLPVGYQRHMVGSFDDEMPAAGG